MKLYTPGTQIHKSGYIRSDPLAPLSDNDWSTCNYRSPTGKTGPLLSNMHINQYILGPSPDIYLC